MSGFYNTEKFASLFCVKQESVRCALCRNGHYLGVVPAKLPNGRLLWPKESAVRLLPSNTSEHQAEATR